MAPQDELRSIAQRRVGTVLRDKYRVDAVIGVGGMAVVFKVTHRNQAEFALKMLHPELSLREDVRSRFLREGYAANSVKHPGAVLVVDDDVAEDGSAFLVMELLDGAPVEDLWERCGRRMSLPAAVSLGQELLDVLAAAHAKNIVHRDIKPANVFVTRDGGVKVLDFGIARLVDAVHTTGATQTGMMMGTPGFMAPEQALGRASEVDGQADVWAAGATLYTLLSGRLVHELSPNDTPQVLVIRGATQPARPLSAIAPEVPASIARVVDIALAFDKAARWPGAGSMRDALRDAYGQAFGEAPSRQPLADVVAGAVASTERPGSPGHVSPPPRIVISTPGRPAMTGSEATRFSASHARPMAGSMTPQPVNVTGPARPRWSAAGLIALAAMLVLGAGAMTASKLCSDRGTPVHAAAIATASSPTQAPSASAPPASVPAPDASVELAAQPKPVAPVAPATPAVSRRVAVLPAPSSSTAPAAPTKPGCDPPYALDAEGRKRFKPECF